MLARLPSPCFARFAVDDTLRPPNGADGAPDCLHDLAPDARRPSATGARRRLNPLAGRTLGPSLVPVYSPAAMHPSVPSIAVLLAFALGSAPAPQSPDVARLVAALAEHSVHLDPERKLVTIPVDVDVRDDLLEYLLVGPAGAAHESAFVTPVQASVLNTALLALALEPGTNAVWRPKDPPPSEPDRRSLRAPTGTLRQEAPPSEAAAPW